MKIFRFCVSGVLLLLIFQIFAFCGDGAQLKEFSSDGCSLFPDSSWVSDDEWCSCCFEHDKAYWRGGSRKERYVADLKLQSCVQEKTGSKVLARVMFEGVRVGGSPYWYTWFRWGYGWQYGRGYQPLGEGEKKEVVWKYNDFLEQKSDPVCGKEL